MRYVKIRYPNGETAVLAHEDAKIGERLRAAASDAYGVVISASRDGEDDADYDYDFSPVARTF
jgi:hypothetical protein